MEVTIMNNEKSDSFELFQENAAAMLKQIEKNISKTMDTSFKDASIVNTSFIPSELATSVNKYLTESYPEELSEAMNKFIESVNKLASQFDFEAMYKRFFESIESLVKLFDNTNISENQALKEQSMIIDAIEVLPVDQEIKDIVIPKSCREKAPWTRGEIIALFSLFVALLTQLTSCINSSSNITNNTSITNNNYYFNSSDSESEYSEAVAGSSQLHLEASDSLPEDSCSVQEELEGSSSEASESLAEDPGEDLSHQADPE